MKKIIILSLLIATLPAFAEIQLRYYMGNLKGNTSSFDNSLESSVVSTPDIESQAKLTGLDFRYLIPLLPLSVGIRHETWKSSKNGDGTVTGNPVTVATTFEASRTCLLGGFTLLSVPIFRVGVLGHYGMSSKMEFERSTAYGPTTRVNKYSGKMAQSYGLALEASATISKLLLGAEAGYTSFKTESICDDGEFLNSDMNNTKWDFSGTYVNLAIGLSF